MTQRQKWFIYYLLAFIFITVLTGITQIGFALAGIDVRFLEWVIWFCNINGMLLGIYIIINSMKMKHVWFFLLGVIAIGLNAFFVVRFFI